jgi:hypothetical protein
MMETLALAIVIPGIAIGLLAAACSNEVSSRASR